jgi:stage V sporulation protein B
LSINIRSSARGSLILLVGQVISTVLSAVGIILVARFLGATSFGGVSVALVPFGFANLFIDWGVSPAIIKYLSQYRFENKPENRRLLIESALLLNILIGTTLTLGLFFSSSYLARNVFLQPDLEILIKYSSLSLFGNSLLRLSWAIAVGYERMELRIGTTIIYSLLKSITGPFLILLGYGPIGAIIGDTGPVLFSGLIGLIIIWILWRSEDIVNPSMTHFEGVYFLLQYGYPLFFSTLILGILPNINQYLLAIYVPNELIGNYVAGIRFSALISFFSMPIATVMFPLFSKLENDHNTLKLVYQNSVKFTAIIILPATMVIITMADKIILILYETGYEHTPLFMRIYMLIFVIQGFGGINTRNLLNGLRETRVNLHASVVTSITTIPLSIILIPRFGVIGLLVASITGAVTGLVYRLIWVQTKLKFTILWWFSAKTLLAAVVSSGISASFIFLIQINPWIELISGGLLYFITYLSLVLTLKILTPTDLNYLENISRTLGPFSTVFTPFIQIIRKISRFQ